MEDSFCMASRARSPRGSLRNQAGFTLMELMITLVVAGVLLGVATPSLRTFLQNNRLSSTANDMLRSFQIARSEAIKRQRNVVVCASANPTAASPTCSYGAFTGWIVFQDTNSSWSVDPGEPILERHESLDPSITVKADNDRIESYASTGFANPPAARNPTRNILLCDVRGNKPAPGAGNNSVERVVLVLPTGRARVSKTIADVNTAAGLTGACP
jgi:type IV fimbrial biogenesis protein FimT